jgi:hypothetical protein
MRQQGAVSPGPSSPGDEGDTLLRKNLPPDELGNSAGRNVLRTAAGTPTLRR